MISQDLRKGSERDGIEPLDGNTKGMPATYDATSRIAWIEALSGRTRETPSAGPNIPSRENT